MTEKNIGKTRRANFRANHNNDYVEVEGSKRPVINIAYHYNLRLPDLGQGSLWIRSGIVLD